MVNPDVQILKDIVVELSDFGIVEWWAPKNPLGGATFDNAKKSDNAIRSGFDVERKRNLIIDRIKKVDENYEDPRLKLKVVPTALKFITIAIIIFFIIISLSKQ